MFIYSFLNFIHTFLYSLSAFFCPYHHFILLFRTHPFLLCIFFLPPFHFFISFSRHSYFQERLLRCLLPITLVSFRTQAEAPSLLSRLKAQNFPCRIAAALAVCICVCVCVCACYVYVRAHPPELSNVREESQSRRPGNSHFIFCPLLLPVPRMYVFARINVCACEVSITSSN